MFKSIKSFDYTIVTHSPGTIAGLKILVPGNAPNRPSDLLIDRELPLETNLYIEDLQVVVSGVFPPVKVCHRSDEKINTQETKQTEFSNPYP